MNKKEVLLRVSNIKTHFPMEKAWLGKQTYLKAVDGVSLTIYRNEIIGLVGESGSGKSTLGRSILKLLKTTSGEVVFEGENILDKKESDLRTVRRKLQLIFQDPLASLNPRMQIGSIIAEPLQLHQIVAKNKIDKKVSELLKEVGLEDYFKVRYPHEMSGGQRQRIAIARVLGLQPEFLIADEAVSGLDISVTVQILNLLKAIQKKSGMSILFISHDLMVIGHIADRILVMYEGAIVEEAASKELLSNPLHPYTKLLAASMPSFQKKKLKNIASLKKAIPENSTENQGCSFLKRCNESQNLCRLKNPVIKESSPGRFVACHFN